MDIFEKIYELKHNGHEMMLVTVIEKSGMSPSDMGKKLLYVDDGSFFGTIGGGLIEHTAIEKCKELILIRKSMKQKYVLNDQVDTCEDNVIKLDMACGGEATLFYEYLGPQQYAYLFGGGHCNKSLASMLIDLNFDVTVIDKREDVLALVDDRTHKINDDFINFITKENFKKQCYIVVATPSHKSDFFVLDKIFEKNIDHRYLGMVCSKKKIADYVNRLKEINPKANLKNLYAPVGLLLGGDSPNEVALSIASEMISIYYHNDDKVTHLRDLLNEKEKYYLW